jgi:glycosyltransferase involved in cell wall biosynthesis
MQPYVSIILPVYNGETTLKSTVKSVLDQTYTDYELVVCIDGTNDGSETILRGFKDPRIKIIKNDKNLGLAGTLNRLMHNLDKASRYVAMAEQDDWYYPERIMLEIEVLDNNPHCGLVSGIAEHLNGNKDKISLFPGILVSGGQYPEKYPDFFRFNYREQIKVVNTCMMFRKSVFVDNGLYFSRHYPNVSVDWSFVLRFSKFASVIGINKVLVRMDRRSERESITQNRQKQYEAARELIRSFYYENRDILSLDDYRYAMTTQWLIELNIYKFFKRIFMLICRIVFGKGDKRVFLRFKKEIIKIPERLLIR